MAVRDHLVPLIYADGRIQGGNLPFMGLKIGPYQMALNTPKALIDRRGSRSAASLSERQAMVAVPGEPNRGVTTRVIAASLTTIVTHSKIDVHVDRAALGWDMLCAPLA